MTGTLKVDHNGFPKDVNMRPVSDTLSFHRRVFPEKKLIRKLADMWQKRCGVISQVKRALTF
jgi:hypothetical protein